MEKTKISIIVPVYNVKQYIRTCIESIIKQSWQNWELILVDDGSTDGSGEICQSFLAKDARIVYYRKSNGGVSTARNVGLEISTGDIISFVDSDDRVDPNFLSDFEIDKIHADIYISGAIYDVEAKPYSFKKYRRRYCRNVNEVRDCFFSSDLINNRYPWGKLFRRDLIEEHQIRFNEKLTFMEDHLFVCQYFLICHTLFLTGTAGYHYLVFDDSGRKLCSKLNTFSELKLGSEAFQSVVNNFNQIWGLDENQNFELRGDFVFARRLLALRSLVLRGEWEHFDEEVAYWRNTDYISKNFKDRFLLFLIRCKLPIFLKKNLVFAFYNCRKALAKDKTTAIYHDLERRSTRY